MGDEFIREAHASIRYQETCAGPCERRLVEKGGHGSPPAVEYELRPVLTLDGWKCAACFIAEVLNDRGVVVALRAALSA